MGCCARIINCAACMLNCSYIAASGLEIMSSCSNMRVWLRETSGYPGGLPRAYNYMQLCCMHADLQRAVSGLEIMSSCSDACEIKETRAAPSSRRPSTILLGVRSCH